MKTRFLSLILPALLVSPLALADGHAVELVRPDGTYPVKPLEKDTVVVKVVQNGVKNLQDFDSVAEGLEHNLAAMVGWAEKACSEGKKPDFILFNEFPLTGYSSGPREEKLKFTIQVPAGFAEESVRPASKRRASALATRSSSLPGQPTVSPRPGRPTTTIAVRRGLLRCQ